MPSRHLEVVGAATHTIGKCRGFASQGTVDNTNAPTDIRGVSTNEDIPPRHYDESLSTLYRETYRPELENLAAAERTGADCK